MNVDRSGTKDFPLSEAESILHCYLRSLIFIRDCPACRTILCSQHGDVIYLERLRSWKSRRARRTTDLNRARSFGCGFTRWKSSHSLEWPAIYSVQNHRTLDSIYRPPKRLVLSLRSLIVLLSVSSQYLCTFVHSSQIIILRIC